MSNLITGAASGALRPQVTIIGDNVASAAPTATGSADLVSAATNVGGIIITSLTMSLLALGATSGNIEFDFVVNSTVYSKLYANAGGAQNSIAIGGLCAIEVPAGQGVGYTLTESDSFISTFSQIYISWRHK